MQPLKVRKVERAAAKDAAKEVPGLTMKLLAAAKPHENPELPLPTAATDTPALKTRAERELIMEVREGTKFVVTPEQYAFIQAEQAKVDAAAEKQKAKDDAAKAELAGKKPANWTPGK